MLYLLNGGRDYLQSNSKLSKSIVVHCFIVKEERSYSKKRRKKLFVTFHLLTVVKDLSPKCPTRYGIFDLSKKKKKKYSIFSPISMFAKYKSHMAYIGIA